MRNCLCVMPRRRKCRHLPTNISEPQLWRVCRPEALASDVSLSDYADSSGRRVGRMKKTNITSAMKQLTFQSPKEDDRAWDEKDSDDDDDERGNVRRKENGDDGDNKDTDDEGKTPMHRRDRKRRRRQGLKEGMAMEGEEEDSGGVDYPLDLWFLISDYIRPEDVGRFAALCHATLYVTTTARFWLSLYKRHYHLSANLPQCLNHWNLDHGKGLRASVICALYHMYPSFCAQLAAEKPLSADPTQLLRAQCILQWHKKNGCSHKYFFKFAHLNSSGGSVININNNSLIHHNPHRGCWVLEASSPSICAVPMVMGEYLYHAGIGVSANLCSHNLHLSLVPAHLLPTTASAPRRRHKVPATEITLDPVTNVRLYPWWHPEYWQLLKGE